VRALRTGLRSLLYSLSLDRQNGRVAHVQEVYISKLGYSKDMKDVTSQEAIARRQREVIRTRLPEIKPQTTDPGYRIREGKWMNIAMATGRS